jgi:hypothetical protein
MFLRLQMLFKSIFALKIFTNQKKKKKIHFSYKKLFKVYFNI